MKEYHKIQTVFKRNPETKFKTLLEGEYSFPEFRYLKDNLWLFTEKVDGTNIRIMWNGTDIQIGGKTDNAQLHGDLIVNINKLLEGKIDYFKENFIPPQGQDVAVCLYGEGYGAGIQKGGGNYRQEKGFVLFDIKIGDYWLQREDVEEIAIKLNIDIVPIVAMGRLEDMVNLVKKGFNSKWGEFLSEGIVARPSTELKTRNGQRIITKLKHKDFLTLKN